MDHPIKVGAGRNRGWLTNTSIHHGCVGTADHEQSFKRLVCEYPSAIVCPRKISRLSENRVPRCGGQHFTRVAIELRAESLLGGERRSCSRGLPLPINLKMAPARSTGPVTASPTMPFSAIPTYSTSGVSVMS